MISRFFTLLLLSFISLNSGLAQAKTSAFQCAKTSLYEQQKSIRQFDTLRKKLIVTHFSPNTVELFTYEQWNPFLPTPRELQIQSYLVRPNDYSQEERLKLDQYTHDFYSVMVSMNLSLKTIDRIYQNTLDEMSSKREDLHIIHIMQNDISKHAVLGKSLQHMTDIVKAQADFAHCWANPK